MDALPSVNSLEETVTALVAGRTQAGGGAAAALTGALGAAVVACAAHAAHEVWPYAGGIAAQATALQRRLTVLARTDAEAYAGALDARGSGDEALGDALDRAAQVPLDIAEAALDVVRLAVLVASQGEQALRADAVAAATLAEAVVRAAGVLVEVNLTVRPGDERLERARALQAAASSELRPLYWPD